MIERAPQASSRMEFALPSIVYPVQVLEQFRAEYDGRVEVGIARVEEDGTTVWLSGERRDVGEFLNELFLRSAVYVLQAPR